MSPFLGSRFPPLKFRIGRIYVQYIWLFTVPEGKPTITAAHNTSATSIYLAWKPPSRDTIHGEFLGYRIGYRRREKADEEMKNVYIRDPAVDVSSVTLHLSTPFVRWEANKKKKKEKNCAFSFSESQYSQFGYFHAVPRLSAGIQPRGSRTCVDRDGDDWRRR